MVKIGINGFGRIGRLILRALLENYKDKIQVVGINDLGSIETNAHLIKYDSTHGTLPHDVSTSKDGFKILNQNIKVFAERDPANLPWGKVGADVVLECTGLFLNKETAGKHLKAGAKKVIVSAPAFKCFPAVSLFKNNPVHSKTTSAPTLPHGKLAGSLSAKTLIF
jgi:glyceraldehyde 3-phosphate dehydrogenase